MTSTRRYAVDERDLAKQGDAAPGLAWFEVEITHECSGYTVYQEAESQKEAEALAREDDPDAECPHDVSAYSTEVPGTRTPNEFPDDRPPPIVNCEGQLTIDDAVPDRTIKDVRL